MLRLIFLLFVLCSSENLLAQEASLNGEREHEVSNAMQTVVIAGRHIKQKGAPYRFLKKFLSIYGAAGSPESPDLRASLVWIDKRPNQHLLLITEQGERQIPVSPYGFFELPEHDNSAESRVQPMDGLGLGVRLGLAVKLPLAQNLNLGAVRRLVAQGNATRKHLPWYIKIAQIGRSGMEYAGVRICFSTVTAGVIVNGHRMPSDEDGCVNLLTRDIEGREESVLTLESPPVFAELIADTKT